MPGSNVLRMHEDILVAQVVALSKLIGLEKSAQGIDSDPIRNLSDAIALLENNQDGVLDRLYGPKNGS